MLAPILLFWCICSVPTLLMEVKTHKRTRRVLLPNRLCCLHSRLILGFLYTPHSPHAMYVDVGLDNSVPPSPDEVIEFYAELRSHFGNNTQLFASTFDNFTKSISNIVDTLPEETMVRNRLRSHNCPQRWC